MRIRKNKITAVLLLAFCYIVGHAISPQLTAPRIGDKVTVLKIGVEPPFADSLELCPDFKYYAFSGEYDLEIWPPSSSDTVSAYIITGNRQTDQIGMLNDTLFLISRTKPGMRRDFSPNPVYGYPASVFDRRTIESTGKTESIGNFATSGIRETEVVSDLYTVTMFGDTIRDVECVITSVKETLIYNDTDTTNYVEKSKVWYAPGYRYPFLWNEEGLLTTLNNEVIDEISLWHMIDFAEQEKTVKDDNVNELIRTRNTMPNDINDAHSSEEKPSGGNTRPHSSGPVNYNPDGEKVVITPGFAEGDYKAYILCDISGRVYSFGDLGSESVSISTASYHPGTYLVYVSTATEPVIYKFIISAR